MIWFDQMERVVRTFVQGGFGITIADVIGHWVHMNTAEKSTLTLAFVVILSIINNYGPKQLRPVAGQIAQDVQNDTPKV